MKPFLRGSTRSQAAWKGPLFGPDGDLNVSEPAAQARTMLCNKLPQEWPFYFSMVYGWSETRVTRQGVRNLELKDSTRCSAKTAQRPVESRCDVELYRALVLRFSSLRFGTADLLGDVFFS